jgi:hypothetical protein
LEGIHPVVPYEHIRELLGSKRELWRKLTCRKACWMDFGI